MSHLNKNWIYLIIIGIVFLIAASIWEFIQIGNGNRDTFNKIVFEMPRDTLFTEEIKDHLTNSKELSLITK